MLRLLKSDGVCLGLLETAWLSRDLLGPAKVCWGLLMPDGFFIGLVSSAKACLVLLGCV